MVGDCLPRIAGSRRPQPRKGLRLAMPLGSHANGNFCRTGPLGRTRLSVFVLAGAGLCYAATSLPADPGGSLHERIDALLREVEAGAPSPLCSDSEFVRRLSIDLLGTLPNPQEVRRFLTDPSPNKR